jgi:hypothetical protein
VTYISKARILRSFGTNNKSNHNKELQSVLGMDARYEVSTEDVPPLLSSPVTSTNQKKKTEEKKKWLLWLTGKIYLPMLIRVIGDDNIPFRVHLSPSVYPEYVQFLRVDICSEMLRAHPKSAPRSSKLVSSSSISSSSWRGVA